MNRARFRRLARGPLRARKGSAGMTLLEIMVSIAILAMIALLIYGAFDSMSRGKKAETIRADRSRQGREAALRVIRELQEAYLSNQNPAMVALLTRLTAFVGVNGSPYDRVDFTAFAHRRYERDAHESDQAEIGFFAIHDPDVEGKYDLVRREQTPIDMYPKIGGVVNVLAENIELFDVKYLDPMTGLWVESWDTTNSSSQPNRLPLEIKVTLSMKAVPGAAAQTFVEKAMIPMQKPLDFGVSR